MKRTEADTRAQFIDPMLQKQQWESSCIRREYYFTDGRKLLGDKRGERCFVDYLLQYKNANLAIIEAKAEHKEPTEGLQQVINYGTKLRVRFVYSTNGKKIYEFDIDEGKGDYVDIYPTPEELFARVHGQNTEQRKGLLSQPYHVIGDMKPRYYQEIAINSVLQSIADGKKRILLTLSTGTGKTFIAFQLVYRLFSAYWNIDSAKRRPKILFLADRNILADQAINTFNPFEKDLLKINGDEIRSRHGKVPTNAFIFFAIYQAISEKENIGGFYKEYPRIFFDLVIIDECHRGSANEAGSWRDILDWFGNAVHVGLTATPKKKDNVDTYRYFGKPVYEYSLAEGINDGFLSPYKVKRIRTNIDEYLYTQEDRVIQGEVENTLYEMPDFESKIVIPQRTELIAKTILEQINVLDKTIVFCVNQAHALMMRDFINKHKEIKDPLYCVRVTSDEGQMGRELLEKFQDNDKDIPAILTSSQMLTTGVDARNVRNIVLVRTINSVVEFKQIVGRGTRLFEGKDFFTIIDFTGASNRFYDADWDGPPDDDIDIEIIDNGDDETNPPAESPTEGGDDDPTPVPPTPGDGDDTGTGEPPEPPRPPEKLIIELSNGRKLRVTDIEVRYIGEDGKPLSATEFLEKLIGFLPEVYQTEEQLRSLWSNPETREEVLKKLAQIGFDEEQLATLREMFDGDGCDIFDVLEHISFSKNMLTRTTRVVKAKGEERFFQVYQNFKAQDFLRFVLDRYEKDDIKELKRDKLADLIRLNNMGTTTEAAKIFGGADKLIDAFYKLQEVIYKVS